MKTTISNYFKYEDILKHPSIKISHDNLIKNYPNYTFLSLYHRDYLDKNLSIELYKDYLLLGSENTNLIFLEHNSTHITIFYINEKEFKDKLNEFREGMTNAINPEDLVKENVLYYELNMTVMDVAEELRISVTSLVQKLFTSMGIFASATQTLDRDTIELIAMEYNFEVKDIPFQKMLNHRC